VPHSPAAEILSGTPRTGQQGATCIKLSQRFEPSVMSGFPPIAGTVPGGFLRKAFVWEPALMPIATLLEPQ